MQRRTSSCGNERLQSLVVGQVMPSFCISQVRDDTAAPAVLSAEVVSSSGSSSSNRMEKWINSKQVKNFRGYTSASIRLSPTKLRSSSGSSNYSGCSINFTGANEDRSTCCRTSSSISSPVGGGGGLLSCFYGLDSRVYSAKEADSAGGEEDQQKEQQQESALPEGRRRHLLREQLLQQFQESATVGAAAEAGTRCKRRAVSSSSTSSSREEARGSMGAGRRRAATAVAERMFCCEDESSWSRVKAKGSTVNMGSSRRSIGAGEKQERMQEETTTERQTAVHEQTGAAGETTAAGDVRETAAEVPQAARDKLLPRLLFPRGPWLQQWFKPLLRNATVFGLRQLLLQLLQLQRHAYVASCLDPTQRVTHILSRGRLTAERHSVRTADGYQIFFYRLQRVRRQCCCCCSYIHPSATTQPAAAAATQSSNSSRKTYEKENRQRCCGSRDSHFPPKRQSHCGCAYVGGAAVEDSYKNDAFSKMHEFSTVRAAVPPSAAAFAAGASAAASAAARATAPASGCGGIPDAAAVQRCQCAPPSCSHPAKAESRKRNSCNCNSYSLLEGKRLQKSCCCCSILERYLCNFPPESTSSLLKLRGTSSPPPPASPGDTAARSTCSRSSSRSESVVSCSSRSSSSSGKDNGCSLRKRKNAATAAAAGRCSSQPLEEGARKYNIAATAAASTSATTALPQQRQQETKKEEEEEQEQQRLHERPKGSDEKVKKAPLFDRDVGKSDLQPAATQEPFLLSRERQQTDFAGREALITTTLRQAEQHSSECWKVKAEEAAAAVQDEATAVTGGEEPAARVFVSSAKDKAAAAAAGWRADKVTGRESTPFAAEAVAAPMYSMPAEDSTSSREWWREVVGAAGAFPFERESSSSSSSERGPVVLMLHGLLESSLNWVSGGSGSLAFMLAFEGCDVWLGNNRGNDYTRPLPLKKKQQKQQHRRRESCTHLQPHTSFSSCLPGPSPGDVAASPEETAVAAAAEASRAPAGSYIAGAGSAGAAGALVKEEGAAAEAAGRGEEAGSVGQAAVRRGVQEGATGDEEACSIEAIESMDAPLTTTVEAEAVMRSPEEAAVAAPRSSRVTDCRAGCAVAGRCNRWCTSAAFSPRCCSTNRRGSNLFQGLSGSELEARLRQMIGIQRQQLHFAGLQQQEPVRLQQQHKEEEQASSEGRGERGAVEISRPEEQNGDAAGTAKTAGGESKAQQNRLFNRCRARWWRRAARSSSSDWCCSTLCCHCTGLTPFPVLGEGGATMQTQRQRLIRACLDAFAVLLLLARCDGRGILRRRQRRTAYRHPSEQQQLYQQHERQPEGTGVEHQQQLTADVEQRKKKKKNGIRRQSQQEWHKQMTQDAGNDQRQNSAEKQQEQRVICTDREECGQPEEREDARSCGGLLRCAEGLQEESSKWLGVFWRGGSRREETLRRGCFKGQEKQRTEKLSALVTIPPWDSAAATAGETAAAAAAARSSCECVVGEKSQQPRDEWQQQQQPQQDVQQDWRQKQLEQGNPQQEKTHRRDAARQKAKNVEAADKEEACGCCSSEDDEVPPFSSALRSATWQRWTYRDMAAYDVPAILDYILSVRKGDAAVAVHARERGRPPTCKHVTAAVRCVYRKPSSSAAAAAKCRTFSTSCLSARAAATSFDCSDKPALTSSRHPQSSKSSCLVAAGEMPVFAYGDQEPLKQHHVLQQQLQHDDWWKRQSVSGGSCHTSFLEEQEKLHHKRSAEARQEQLTRDHGWQETGCTQRKENGSLGLEDSHRCDRAGQEWEEEEEEEETFEDYLGGIWAVGQSQGAAQLLGMLSLYPSMGLLFRGVLLFSPPVVLQSPASLSVSARMFIRLALQMPEKVLLSIRAAEQLLPLPLLSIFGDLVAGKRLMGFYTGSISWNQRRVNFRYTPSGGTSKRNFDLWVGSMCAATSNSSSDHHNARETGILPCNETMTFARSAGAGSAPAEVTISTPAKKQLDLNSTATSEEDAFGVRRSHEGRNLLIADGEAEAGNGSASSFLLGRICCPIVALLGGKDNLVDADASAAHLSRCLEKKRLLHVEVWEESGHLDFGWGHARRVDLYPRLVHLILSRRYFAELQEHCLQLVLQQQQ